MTQCLWPVGRELAPEGSMHVRENSEPKVGDPARWRKPSVNGSSVCLDLTFPPIRLSCRFLFRILALVCGCSAFLVPPCVLRPGPASRLERFASV